MRQCVFDIEADGLLDTVSRFWCGVVKDLTTGDNRKFTDAFTMIQYLNQFDEWIGHNIIGYDIPVLRKLFRLKVNNKKLTDTLIISQTQRLNRIKPKGSSTGPHSLESWGIRLGHHKIEHEEWDRFSPEMMRRCEEDVNIQTQLYYYLLEEGKGEGWEKAHALNMKLFYYLQLQQEFGWYIDQKKLDYNIRTLNRWIQRIDRSIINYLPMIVEIQEQKKDGEYGYVRRPFKKNGTHTLQVEKTYGENNFVCGPFSRVSFRRVDPDKNVEVKDFLLSQGWEPEVWNTNNEGQRTSPKLSKDDPFNGIQGSLGRLIARRVQCKQRRGVLQGLKDSIRPDGRIGSVAAGVASTGRLRHSVIVNIPSPDSGAFFAKQMREIFSCPEGKILVGCDSKGNQLRQLAARMQENEFTNAVLFGNKEDGTDLHAVNQKITGVPTRTAAKNFFYGLLFGAGDPKLGKLVGGGKKEGEDIRARYVNRLKGLGVLLDSLKSEWRKTAVSWYNAQTGRHEYKNGYITGIDGRPILVESEHAILNYALQSDEAIHMAVAYVIFNKWMEKKGYTFGKEYGCVIWYHDEFQVECDEVIKEEVSDLAEKAIAWAGQFLGIACPHEGDSQIGRNWAETH